MGGTQKGWRPTPLQARAIPFVLFAGVTLLQGIGGAQAPFWIYSAKTLFGLALVFWMWPWVTEARWEISVPAVSVGVLVFILWVGLDPFYGRLPGLGSRSEGWNPHAVFPPGWMPWLFIGVRLLGSTLIVPILEEVFYRSLLYRYLARADFESVSLTQFRAVPFAVTCLVFGLAHYEWLAGILCGAAYQALVIRTGRLGEAMTAHAVTNLLLGCWVVWREDWKFW